MTLALIESAHEALGLTYQEIARALQVDESTLHRWRAVGAETRRTSVGMRRVSALRQLISTLEERFSADWKAARAWLAAPHERCGGRAPRALLIEGRADFLTGMLLEAPEERSGRGTRADPLPDVEVAAARLEIGQTTGADDACDGVWELDTVHGDVCWSPQIATTLGRDPRDVVADLDAFEAFVHPDDIGMVREALQAYFAGRTRDYRAEFRMRHGNGSWRWIHARGRALSRDAEGRPTRLGGLHSDVTERHDAEVALRASEERLALALEAASAGVWDWDIATGAVHFSPTWCRMLGYEPDEIAPHVRSWEALVHPDDASLVTRSFANHLEGRSPTYETVHRCRRKDGTCAWVFARGRIVARDGDGRPLRVVGTHTDVTARKRAEMALADSQALSQRLIDASPDCITTLDASGRIVTMNAAGRRALELLETQQFQDRDWSTLWAGDAVLRSREAGERARRGETVHFEGCCPTKSGARKWWDVAVVPLLASDATPGGVLAVWRDVTEKRAADAALRTSEHRLAAALEASGNGLWEWDMTSDAALYDEQWLRSVGLDAAPPPPLTRTVWLDRIHVDDRAHVDYQMEAHLAGLLESIAIEHRMLTAGGEWRWMLARGRVIERAPDGSPLRVSGTLADISEGIRLEEDRAVSLRDAERARAELEITNEYLRQQAASLKRGAAELQQLSAVLATTAAEERRARAEADREREAAQHANRVKAEFLATMSHELRTPLNAIQGYVQLIDLGIHGPVTEAQRQALSRIDQSQRHLLSLITDILHFAKVESGHLTFNIERVPVLPLLQLAADAMVPQFAGKGVTLTVDPDVADDLAISADVERVQQILLNLLTNAYKFTEARDGKAGVVRLGAHRLPTTTPGSRDAVAILVRDTGRGIPAPMLEHIFESFVQLERGRMHSAQVGVGLGLAISRDLARGMGGDLVAESTLGTSSLFTLTLPAA